MYGTAQNRSNKIFQKHKTPLEANKVVFFFSSVQQSVQELYSLLKMFNKFWSYLFADLLVKDSLFFFFIPIFYTWSDNHFG